jgi:hypothetical protein
MVSPGWIIYHEFLLLSLRGYLDVPPGGDHPLIVFRVDMWKNMPPFHVGVPDKDMIGVLDHDVVEGLIESCIFLDLKHIS